MIKVLIEIEQLPCVTNGKVRGALNVTSRNINATSEEINVLGKVMEKMLEIGHEISEEKHSEVTMWAKKKKVKCTTSQTR